MLKTSCVLMDDYLKKTIHRSSRWIPRWTFTVLCSDRVGKPLHFNPVNTLLLQMHISKVREPGNTAGLGQGFLW